MVQEEKALMKKKKRVIVLISLAVLLALLVGAYISLKSYNIEQAEESETEDSSVIVTSIPKEDIIAFSYLSEGKKMEFKKDADTWKYEEDKNFPVDQIKAEELADRFSQVKALRDLGQLENLDEYGLEDASNQITVTQKDGTESIFYVGSQNTTTGYYYMYMDNPQHIYTVDSSMIGAFEGKLYDLAADDSLPSIPVGSVKTVEITQKEKKLVLASSQDDSATWSVKDETGKEVQADDTKTMRLFENLTSLNYKDYIDYDCKDLDKYGLKESAGSLKIEYTETLQVPMESESELKNESETESEAVQTVTEKKEMTLLIGNQDEYGDYYVTLSQENKVHTMSADTLKPWLEASYQDFPADSGEAK